MFFNSGNYMEMQIETTVGCDLTPVRVAIIIITFFKCWYWQGFGQIGTLYIVECQNDLATLESSMVTQQKK